MLSWIKLYEYHTWRYFYTTDDLFQENFFKITPQCCQNVGRSCITLLRKKLQLFALFRNKVFVHAVNTVYRTRKRIYEYIKTKFIVLQLKHF